MSCISSNFSSFFLNSLNDPSEFSKYLSNGELKCTNFEEFQVFGCGAGAPSQQQQQHQQQYSHTHLPNGSAAAAADFPNYEATTASQRENSSAVNSGSSVNPAHYAAAAASANVEASVATAAPTSNPGAGAAGSTPLTATPPSNRWPTAVATPNGHQSTASSAGSVPQHFDGSFEFIKYLRHSTDFTPSTPSSVTSEASSCPEKPGSGKPPGIPAGTTPPPPAQSPVASGLIDLDTSTSQKSRSASRKVAALLSSVSRASNSLVDTSSSALDVFDHDSKQTIFDLQHMASNGSSNSNESSLEMLAFPNSHLNASNSNTSSEGAACGSAGEFGGLLTGASCSSSTASSSSHAPKLLGSFVIKENFEVHPSHKVEEGIFQHMNKLPSKKKDTLKQLGVRFTGQMTLTDKSIVVENFIKFCEEYDIKDHRPWLSLNQCGLNKPEQIKFARYLGQGLPTFTLFCIYSNFKNLFCTKRTEIYTKDGYNLPYILDKTKRFLANTTAGDNTNNNITNNTSNKTNNNTSTTTTSTPVKQTPQQQQSEQELLAPNSPATPKLATAATAAPAGATAVLGAATPTQAVPRTRPATPTMPVGAAAGTPTTPQQQQQHHLQQHQQQQHQQQQPQQQHMLQHPHTHPHPHAQHSHPHTLPHSHAHHLQPGTPTRSSHPQLQHPHHYSPSPHPHPHHQAGHHGHPHAHHFAYAHGHPHPQQHHPHYYPHPHAHVQHMAAMGYPGPPQSSQQATGGGSGAVGGVGAGGATGGAGGSAGGSGGLPPTAM
uniref:Uncharacterized protein LOC108052305 isoform X1 n=1 Tax=Drosophila rhopaloa TaxID=1041015 RepID=A0A6P4FI55_DRORH